MMRSNLARRFGLALESKEAAVIIRNYSVSSCIRFGFDEFFDTKAKPNEPITTGRAWTTADLRRKSFDDLHKLWYVLYKERNLLLSEKEKTRRNLRPVLKPDENRYMKVKKSMAGIKVVLNERKRIEKMIENANSSDSSSDSSSKSATT